MIDREDVRRCNHIPNTKRGLESAAEACGDNERRFGEEQALGGFASAPLPDPTDVNRDVREFPRHAVERRGLALEREENSNGHVSCHISILKLSPSRAFMPSAAATSYPE